MLTSSIENKYLFDKYHHTCDNKHCLSSNKKKGNAFFLNLFQLVRNTAMYNGKNNRCTCIWERIGTVCGKVQFTSILCLQVTYGNITKNNEKLPIRIGVILTTLSFCKKYYMRWYSHLFQNLYIIKQYGCCHACDIEQIFK